jgi:isoleucyl-tRNA synthetase
MNPFASSQNTILEQWNSYGMHRIFDIKNININSNSNSNSNDNTKLEKFTFLAGPPFCSGKLHIGHCAIETIKSTILNYKAMQKFLCTNKLGYDCHGLPIESIANRELNINTTEDLERIGIVTFNQFCKDTIKQCEHDWEPVYNRIARWTDFTNVYKTIDTPFMESVWWAFSELYRKKLIYRGYKITPYSYALQSPLSNFEASQNYKDVECRSIYVRFEVLPKYQYENKPTYFVAWTTTPWTLPANVALCVNPNLEYEYVEDDVTHIVYIIGKDKHKQSGLKITTQPLKTVRGSQLIGIKYKPIFPTYTSPYENENEKKFTVVADGYVKDGATTGTNIVHLAPVFGEDDYRVCKLNHIITDELVQSLIPIDDNCKYLPCVKQYAGMLVFDAETQIIKDLKATHTLIKIQQIRHEYPYCYRTDTPLVYRTYNSFYVNIEPIKHRMIELNKQTKWYPDTTGTKRFNNWLEDSKDWCISRSRYFGTPIPVWISEDNNDFLVISSIRQLENLSGLVLSDIHPEYVNDIVITNPDNGKVYRRIPDVFDCWFESGSVPFAQHHYPFENKNILEEHITNNGAFADFIAEGVDQTRGWFYTLLVLSTALFDIMPAKNIMSVGHIQDEHHKKISKRNKNYVDPLELLDKYGADAIRLYLLQSPITTGDPLAFKQDDLKLVNKELFQYKNSVDFLLEHITNQRQQNIPIQFDILAYQRTNNSMDKWILQYMNKMSAQIINFMNTYQIAKAARQLFDAIEDITNWYVKFNRDRLKGKTGDDEWIISTSVLYQVISKYNTLLAPFAPFVSQLIYQQINSIHQQSYMFVHMERFDIHILDYPSSQKTNLDCRNDYIETFELLKRVSKLIRAARMKTQTHTSSKTPIKSCNICMDNPDALKQISQCIELIQSELNIIDIEYGMLSENLKYKLKPNKPLLGKKYKKQANDIYNVMNTMIYDSKTDITGKSLDITIGEDKVTILEDEYILEPIFGENDIFDIQSQSLTQNNILIKIDFTFDEHIEKMAHLKRFIADVQQTRKHMGLKPWNAIIIHTYQDDFDIIADNVDFIKKRLECDIIPDSHYDVHPTKVRYYESNVILDEQQNKQLQHIDTIKYFVQVI